MSEVINFPTKQQMAQADNRSPQETLDYISDLMEVGDTKADQLIVAWAYRDEDQLHLRYMMGGDPSLTATVGILEMVKSDLIT